MNQETTSTAQQLSLWADTLRHISANGLLYSTTVYDLDNYRIIQDIAMGLMAVAGGQTAQEIEPLREPIFSRPTPLVVCDAAIIDETGKMLLIRRADNKQWAMPGGGSDVGETPAQAAMREALEETGVHCEAIALVAVHDSRLHRASSRHHMYMMSFLCRPLDKPKEQPASHGHEVLETAWFSEAELPTAIDPNHVTRIPEAFRVWKGDQRTFFDL